MFLKAIDESKCTSCMLCADICTNSQVIVQNKTGKPEFRYSNRCIGCGHCMAFCPQGAISFAPAPAADIPYYAKTIECNPIKPPLSSDAVFDFLCFTRTNRIFLNRPLEREMLETLAAAMVRSPSAGNEQNRMKTKERIFEAALTLFSEKGFNATTLREITKLAGISPGSLYMQRRIACGNIQLLQRPSHPSAERRRFHAGLWTASIAV